MSLCDRCYDPGHCCKGLFIGDAAAGTQPTSWTDAGQQGALELMKARGLPFEPLRPHQVYTDDAGRRFQDWLWSCPKLGADGRCTIYEDRPDLCRRYQPQSDWLCVHFRGTESGDPSFDGEMPL